MESSFKILMDDYLKQQVMIDELGKQLKEKGNISWNKKYQTEEERQKAKNKSQKKYYEKNRYKVTTWINEWNKKTNYSKAYYEKNKKKIYKQQTPYQIKYKESIKDVWKIWYDNTENMRVKRERR